MKKLKSILNWLMFLIGGGGEIKRYAVENNICDYSGEGRDKFGR